MRSSGGATGPARDGFRGKMEKELRGECLMRTKTRPADFRACAAGGAVTAVTAAFLTMQSAVAAVHFRESFDEADPADWSADRGPETVIVKEQGNAFLRVAGRQQLALRFPCGKLRDFVLSVRVRGPGGVHFRDGYKVFFKGDGTMWFRRPGAMLLRWVRERRDLDRFHEIRIVAAGRIVRIYVDDVVELECLDHAPIEAPFALCGSGDFDDIRLEDAVPVEEALMAVPRDAGANFFEENSHERMRIQDPRVPDTALVFGKGEAVRAPVRVLNESDEDVEVNVDAWLDRFDEITVGDRKAQALTLAAGAEQETAFVFGGGLPPGFLRLNLALSRAGRHLRTTPYPVFVGVPAEAEALREPELPVGVFLATIVWKPLHTKAYWHAIASMLRARGLNAVVATGGCHREFPEIFARYGVSTLVRSENRLEHAAVIGLVNSAARPETMLKLQGQFEKPVLTYLKVENVGSGEPDDPLRVWRATQPRVRFLRIHPFRRDGGDWTGKGGGALPLPDALRLVSEGCDSPWWALLQCMGNAEFGGEYRSPSPAELSAQTHLALARGAKGLLYYCLQSDDGATAVLDPVSLKPVDAKLDALGALGAWTGAHAQRLRAFRPGARDLAVEPGTVIAVPGSIGDAACVYVVNTDVTAPVSCRVALSAQAKPGAQPALRLELAPGEGRLLELEQ